MTDAHPTPTTADPRALARVAAASLSETAKSLADLGPGFEAAQDDPDFCDELDALVFVCEACGWWCDADDRSDSDGVCADCASERS